MFTEFMWMPFCRKIVQLWVVLLCFICFFCIWFLRKPQRGIKIKLRLRSDTALRIAKSPCISRITWPKHDIRAESWSQDWWMSQGQVCEFACKSFYDLMHLCHPSQLFSPNFFFLETKTNLSMHTFETLLQKIFPCISLDTQARKFSRNSCKAHTVLQVHVNLGTWATWSD